MLTRYIAHMHTNEPVHTWPLDGYALVAGAPREANRDRRRRAVVRRRYVLCGRLRRRGRQWLRRRLRYRPASAWPGYAADPGHQNRAGQPGQHQERSRVERRHLLERRMSRIGAGQLVGTGHEQRAERPGDGDTEAPRAPPGGRERGQPTDQQRRAEHQHRTGQVERPPDRAGIRDLPFGQRYVGQWLADHRSVDHHDDRERPQPAGTGEHVGCHRPDRRGYQRDHESGNQADGGVHPDQNVWCERALDPRVLGRYPDKRDYRRAAQSRGQAQHDTAHAPQRPSTLETHRRPIGRDRADHH